MATLFPNLRPPNMSTPTGSTYAPPPKPYVISGLLGNKAASPTGATSNATNTIPPKYTAPKSQQTATGNNANAASTAQPQMKTPSGLPITGNPATYVGVPSTPPTTPSSVVGGLVGATTQAVPQMQQSIAQTQGAQTSPQAQQFTQQVGQYGAGNIPIGQQAASIGAQYGSQISDLQKSMALQEAANASSGAPVGLGRAGLIAQYGGQLMQGLSQAEQAALAGTGQQLTAQQQAANAAAAASGQAYTGLGYQQSAAQQAANIAQAQQGLTQGGLGTAAGLLPEALRYGAFGAGAGGAQTGAAPTLTYNLQQDAINFAKAVMNGTMTYDQAIASLGYQGNIATGNLNAAIQAMGGNPLSLQARGAGTQNVLGSIPQLQSANLAAKGIQNTITSFLAQNPQINPSDLGLANAAQQWVQGQQLTDPKYQTLFNYLAEYTNTLAPILGVGGDPTNLKTQIAQGFINARASGGSIADVLNSIGQLADQKVQNLQVGAQGQTTPTGGGGSFVQGQTAAGGGLTWDGSKWVVSQ